jgi:hypothetical protein
MIHLAQESYVKITEVARNDEVHDLSQTIRKCFVSGAPAAKHYVHILRPVTLAGNVAPALYISSVLAKIRDPRVVSGV